MERERIENESDEEYFKRTNKERTFLRVLMIVLVILGYFSFSQEYAGTIMLGIMSAFWYVLIRMIGPRVGKGVRRFMKFLWVVILIVFALAIINVVLHSIDAPMKIL